MNTFSPGVGTTSAGTCTPVANSSGNVAATATTATLAAVPGKTTYIEGFDIMGLGATGASTISVTVTGLAAGTQTFLVNIPAGATVLLNANGQPFAGYSWRFPTPLPASGANTAIVVNMPSFGTGNTNAAVVAYGFQA